MFWFKKKIQEEVKPIEEVKPPEEERQPPRLTFEIRPDGDVTIACSWPRPLDNKDAGEIVQSFSSLIFLLITGRFTPAIQHAIADFHQHDKAGQEMAKAILLYLHQMLVQEGNVKLSTHPHKPLVSPREAFKVRGDQ